MFSPVVTGHWLAGTPSAAVPGGGCTVVVDDSLPDTRAVTLLQVDDGPVVLTLTTAHAHRLDLDGHDELDRDELGPRLEHTGIVLHDPDHLCYLPTDSATRTHDPDHEPGHVVRRLTAADAEEFARFTDQASADDVDEAFVELDHWLALGLSTDGEGLVCAGSAIAWQGTSLADLGVLTLPTARGRGHGTRTVRALSAQVLAEGHEPQYRCQLDNVASYALARATGFRRFGVWQTIDVEASAQP